MVFKKMLSAFGVGGPSVDTVLTNPNTRPGLSLDGHVNLVGGDAPASIEQISISLVTRVEVESGGSEYAGMMEFHRMPVSGRLELAPKQQLSIPFQFPIPWETPVTDVYGHRLHGMTMGLRTEVAVARAVDKGDLDHVAVHPLPIHERILEAFQALGFRFKHADLERGHIYGVQQTLPFYQEIEFFAAPQYAQAVNEVELTFVTSPQGVEVILECDKRGGFFTGGQDVIGRYAVPHSDASRTDWVQVVDGWLRETTSRYGSLRAQGYGMPPGGHYPPQGHYAPQGHYGHQGHQGHRGSGMGGMLAAGALGVVGGMVAGELIEDAFEGFGDDDGGDE
ncbi:sporulation protein [Micromonospora eburnea]|uniref:Sporulation-control protein n=1 Tax=Micromonospora eburnea TaxID=227316 RepID=A0A1C6U2V4_9ACTN|nr:sporulation protein [Micromonospora eburnea]SCL48238.1 sporulation-control protein [Micromonospora eburnea]